MVISLDDAQIRAIAGAQIHRFEVPVGRVDTENTPARHSAVAPDVQAAKAHTIGNAFRLMRCPTARRVAAIRHDPGTAGQ